LVIIGRTGKPPCRSPRLSSNVRRHDTLMRLIVPILAMCAAWLQACASIPVSTAIHLSQLNAQSLQAVEPQNVRVRVQVSPPVALDIGAATLELAASSGSAIERRSRFALEALGSRTVRVDGGFLSRERLEQVYEVVLARTAYQAFREARSRSLSDTPSRIQLSVDVPLQGVPTGVSSLIFSVAVQLEPSGPFMVLVREANIQVGQALK
jgi:hypothetical protein